LENFRKENVGDWQLFKARKNEAGKNILVLQSPTGKLAFTDDPSAMLLSALDDFTDEEGGKTVLEVAKLLRKRQ
jgi:hypothetical protein